MFKFLTVETALQIAEAILPWNSRLEFAMHGEPTMNPDLEEILKIFGGRQIMMTSNGGGLLEKGVDRVLDAGVNVLALDDYGYANIVERVMKIPSKYPIHQYPEELKWNPHKRHKGHRTIVLQDISEATHGTHSTLNNGCGASFPKSYGYSKRCAKPFREMAVRYNGQVSICCNDWRGEYPICHVSEGPWNHPRMRSARRMLYHERRDFGACDGCDAKSYRLGLLPDKMGHEYLREPSEEDLAIVNDVQGPLVQIVKRDYEK